MVKCMFVNMFLKLIIAGTLKLAYSTVFFEFLAWLILFRKCWKKMRKVQQKYRKKITSVENMKQ